MNHLTKKEQQLGKREVSAALIAILNSFSWYFPLYILFATMLDSLHIERSALLSVYSLHYAAIIAFAFVGNFLVNRLKRDRLLSIWMLIGILASMLMLLLNSGKMEWVYLVSFSLGLSLGLGFPSCLAYFADQTDVNRRGSIGGIIYFFTSIGMFAIGFLTTISDYVTSVMILTLWRGLGLIFFLCARQRLEQQHKAKDVATETAYVRRGFILYFIPWTMFCLINFLEIPFFDIPLQQFFLGTDLRYLISIGEFGIGGISALICGRFSDIVGRKRMIILAYVMVGIGYAVLSFSYSSVFALYLYVLLDGVAWGIFALMFFLIIWGDLAMRQKERYYLAGILPFLISSFVSVLVTPYAPMISLSTAFSLASFFLFLAILPLVYAPETLPEKHIKEQEVKQYIEKAKKTKEEHT